MFSQEASPVSSDAITSSTSAAKRSRTGGNSIIWKHFDDVGGNKVKCRFPDCYKEYTIGPSRSTKNPLHHLMKKHHIRETSTPVDPATITPVYPATITPSTSTAKRPRNGSSIVWTHFGDIGGNKVKCRFPNCGAEYSVGLSRSTKNPLRHLKKKHHIYEMSTSVSPEVITPSTSTAQRSQNGSSIVWKHFEDIGGNKVKCRFPNCGVEYSIGPSRSTKNPLHHLMKKHHIQETRRSQTTIDSLFALPVRPLLTKASLERASVKLIVQNMVPFTFFTSDSFREYSDLLNDRFKELKFDRAAVLNKMFQMYLVRLAAIKSELAAQVSVSLTCDIWTSPDNISYFGVTAHYINQDFKPISLSLSLKEVDGTHDASAISSIINNVIGEYEIEGNVLAVTFDDASSNIAAIPLLEDNTDCNCTVRCMTHIVNLIAKAGLRILDSGSEDINDIHNILSKIRSFSKMISMSPQLQQRFTTYASINLQTGFPILDVRTKWNSTCDMLERAAELAPTIDLFISRESGMSEFRLDDLDWAKVDLVISILQPLKEMYEIFSQDGDGNIGGYISAFENLKTTLENLEILPEMFEVDDVINGILIKVTEYCSKIKDNDALRVADLLRPKGFFTKEEFDFLKEKSRMFFNFQDLTETVDDVGLKAKIFGSRIFSTLDSELLAYSRMSNSSTHNLVDFWAHAPTLPTLRNMARYYLSIQASSAPVERLFSKCQLFLTDEQNKLPPESLQALVCLNSWGI
ncbi:hypothetical protein B5S31_g2921 [[Candida] boidinii]|nr:hypothetical protein B5S31_g2921 [[Candida] boidinii]